MRKLTILLLCLFSLMAIVPAFAQEDDTETEPETPVNSPSDNWCYDGGPFEGKCGLGDTAESNWMWLYGFYRAQIAKGVLSFSDLPAEYRFEQDAGVNTSASGIFLDGNGNIIASGASPDFVGYIVECDFGSSSTSVKVGWQGLDIQGDRITVGTPSGAGSTNTIIPLSGTLRLKFGDPVDRIEPDGTMNVFRDGVLIGTSDLNGLNECDDES